METIPKCYYNIFFIYYEKFSLEVKPLTEFPAMVNCPSLFRFGFDLEPEIWEYFLLSDKTLVLANARTNCGFPGITKVINNNNLLETEKFMSGLKPVIRISVKLRLSTTK
jgi:hypothetical protein